MMRHVIAAVAIALVACAQSPHVYRPELLDTWDGVPKSLGGGLNSSGRPLFHIKPLGTDPFTNQQEARIPPSFPYPGCFFCPDVPVDEDAELDAFEVFTTDWFIQHTRAANYQVELRDKCVFYTTRTVFHATYDISRGATSLACEYEKYSIWHLWTNAKNEYDTRNNPKNERVTNLYGIFVPGSRLNYIRSLPPVGPGKDASIQYFENMSRAMARMCSGQIYLVTDMRQNLDLTQFEPGGLFWPNIWASTELPELGNGIVAGRVNGGFLIVVDFVTIPSPRPVAWKVDWRSLAKLGDMGTMWTRSNGTHGGYRIPHGWEEYDLAGELGEGGGTRMQRRDTCLEDTGIDSQPGGMDFFG